MTKNKIKETALHFFAEKGYEATSLSEIASAVGIKTPSIYGHFQSKEQLMLEIWEDLVDDYRALMEGILEEVQTEKMEEQILDLIRGYGQYFKQRPESYYLWARMMMFPPLEFKDRTLQDCLSIETIIYDKISGRMTAAINKGEIREAPVEDLLNAFTVLKEGYVQWLTFYCTDDAEKQLKSLWPLLWHGLGNN
jgi:AcrR family transcriptional regulator